MEDLLKATQLGVRFTEDQRRRIERAAKIVSRRKGELTEPSTLVRELAMPEIDAILESATVAELEAVA